MRANSESLQDELRHAAKLLREGKLVAFPTETVYGLGANALDSSAVARIFEAKGRPGTSPLIVHISSDEMLHRVVRDWPEAAARLTEQFWPGPLTLVLPKQPAVPPIVTAGLDTVGVRMPAHELALALIRAAGVPVAAPSANRFTQLSPTTAEHVRQGLGHRVDYILDGGPCAVGIESTVLSLAGDRPTLLRPGGISRQQIEAIVGPLDEAATPAQGAHPSPGMHARHYSPRTRLVFAPDGAVPKSGTGAYLQWKQPPDKDVRQVVHMPERPREYAAQLYLTLHELDGKSLDWIAVELPPSEPEWEGVLDRLRRAATPEPG